MKLAFNILIILAIIALAICLGIKNFRRSKQGKCAACDYDCVLKKQPNKKRRESKVINDSVSRPATNKNGRQRPASAVLWRPFVSATVRKEEF